MKYTTKKPEETFRLGTNFGKKLKPGSIVALIGELGTGKTLFTKGIAKGLDIKYYEHVNSPSFVIVKENHPLLSAFYLQVSLERNGIPSDISPSMRFSRGWRPGV